MSSLLSVTAQNIIGKGGDRPARFDPKIFLDSSYVECIFSYKVYDPAYDETREYFKILEVGKNISKYGNYGEYQLDSIIARDYPDGMTLGQYLKLAHPYSISQAALIKEFLPDSIVSYDKVSMDHYVYSEPLSVINWSLVEDNEQVCGYTCRKATTSFRGRNWTAWYCPDITIDNGPWKFGGLPGLILKVESDDGEQLFEAVAIRPSHKDIYIDKKNRQKTTREKYNKELEEYMTHPRQYHIANPKFAPKDKDGNIAISEFRRLFFNPIELE